MTTTRAEPLVRNAEHTSPSLLLLVLVGKWCLTTRRSRRLRTGWHRSVRWHPSGRAWLVTLTPTGSDELDGPGRVHERTSQRSNTQNHRRRRQPGGPQPYATAPTRHHTPAGHGKVAPQIREPL